MRILLALSFATALALPVQAQFAIVVQQNGHASAVANGGSVAMNAPGPTQSTSATVTVTYVGSATANFPSDGQILGATSFTVTGDSAGSLAPFQSTTFTLNYSPASTAQSTSEFLWPYNETVNNTNGAGTTTVSSGAIELNLNGTAPNLIVGQITSTGVFQPVANGGTVQIPSTAVNTTTTTTIGISNSGSGPGTINSITVTGTGYQLGSVPSLPIVVNPGSQLNVTLQFQPTSAAQATGSLQVAFASGNYTATISSTGVTSFLSYNVTQGGTTSPLVPGQTIAFGGTVQSSAIVQFQNTGATPYVLSTVAISGAGFSITDAPFLPTTLQPQQSNTITVTYTPTGTGPSTGRFLVGNDSFALSAQGLTFTYQSNGGVTPIIPGGTISFAPVVDGQTETVQFTVTNPGSTAAPLTTIGVADPTGVFTLANLPALPLQLAPSASVSFNINFSPVSSGVSSATLAINNQAFGLTGFPATPPPLPSYSFTGASGTVQPFQQPSIGLSLATPYSYPLFGTLTLGIASSGFGPDPAVQFSSGGTQTGFTIPANTLQAVFPNGATQIQLQTGTVAGLIQVTPSFTAGTTTGTDVTPANLGTLALTVPSAAPTILSATVASTTTTSLTILVAGFSTTRSLDHMTFQLTPASGFTLSATSFPVDVSSAAALWFESSASQSSGGQFDVEIPFTFSESSAAAGTNLIEAISAISVSVVNSTGASNAVQVVP